MKFKNTSLFLILFLLVFSIKITASVKITIQAPPDLSYSPGQPLSISLLLENTCTEKKYLNDHLKVPANWDLVLAADEFVLEGGAKTVRLFYLNTAQEHFSSEISLKYSIRKQCGEKIKELNIPLKQQPYYRIIIEYNSYSFDKNDYLILSYQITNLSNQTLEIDFSIIINPKLQTKSPSTIKLEPFASEKLEVKILAFPSLEPYLYLILVGRGYQNNVFKYQQQNSQLIKLPQHPKLANPCFYEMQLQLALNTQIEDDLSIRLLVQGATQISEDCFFNFNFGTPKFNLFSKKSELEFQNFSLKVVKQNLELRIDQLKLLNQTESQGLELSYYQENLAIKVGCIFENLNFLGQAKVAELRLRDNLEFCGVLKYILKKDQLAFASSFSLKHYINENRLIIGELALKNKGSSIKAFWKTQKNNFRYSLQLTRQKHFFKEGTNDTSGFRFLFSTDILPRIRSDGSLQISFNNAKKTITKFDSNLGFSFNLSGFQCFFRANLTLTNAKKEFYQLLKIQKNSPKTYWQWSWEHKRDLTADALSKVGFSFLYRPFPSLILNLSSVWSYQDFWRNQSLLKLQKKYQDLTISKKLDYVNQATSSISSELKFEYQNFYALFKARLHAENQYFKIQAGYNCKFNWSFPLLRKPLGSLKGRVYYEHEGEKFGLSDITIFCANQKAITDKDGYYYFEELAVGTVSINLDCASIPFIYQINDDLINKVKIENNKTQRLNFQVFKKGVIYGRIRTAECVNLKLNQIHNYEKVRVYLQRECGETNVTNFDSAGEFKFELLEKGKYIIYIDYENIISSRYYLEPNRQELFLGPGKIDLEFKIKARHQKINVLETEYIFSKERLQTLKGWVYSSNTPLESYHQSFFQLSPFPNASIIVTDLDYNVYWRTKTNDLGMFEISSLSPQGYYLFVTSDFETANLKNLQYLRIDINPFEDNYIVIEF